MQAVLTAIRNQERAEGEDHYDTVLQEIEAQAGITPDIKKSIITDLIFFFLER